MEGIETILSRRSIRSFTPEPIGEETLTILLRAAMAAPSAGNQQPWHFVVVTDPEVRRELSGASPNAALLAAAPLGVAVCGDTAAEYHPGYWIQDCAAAVENLLLAAHALGLGGVWLGFHPREERVQRAREILDLPPQVIPLAVVALGHPSETKPPADRYRPERIHRDRW